MMADLRAQREFNDFLARGMPAATETTLLTELEQANRAAAEAARLASGAVTPSSSTLFTPQVPPASTPFQATTPTAVLGLPGSDRKSPWEVVASNMEPIITADPATLALVRQLERAWAANGWTGIYGVFRMTNLLPLPPQRRLYLLREIERNAKITPEERAQVSQERMRSQIEAFHHRQ